MHVVFLGASGHATGTPLCKDGIDATGTPACKGGFNATGSRMCLPIGRIQEEGGNFASAAFTSAHSKVI